MKFTFVLAIFALAGTAFAETNAERFRRGLGPLKPRHFGTQTTQVAQPCEFAEDENFEHLLTRRAPSWSPCDPDLDPADEDDIPF